VSTLTSGPPVIQQQVKSLYHHLGSFSPSGTEAIIGCTLAIGVFGLLMVLDVIFSSPLNENNPGKLVIDTVIYLFGCVSVFMWGMLGIWLCRLAVGLCTSSLYFLLRLVGVSTQPHPFSSNV